jgi:hypothetical protein
MLVGRDKCSRTQQQHQKHMLDVHSNWVIDTIGYHWININDQQPAAHVSQAQHPRHRSPFTQMMPRLLTCYNCNLHLELYFFTVPLMPPSQKWQAVQQLQGASPWDGKQHREELWREAHGAVHQATVEVHVGVQLAADKVLVSKGSILQTNKHTHTHTRQQAS